MIYLIYRRKPDGLNILLDKLYCRESAIYALQYYQYVYGYQYVYLKQFGGYCEK